MVTEYCSGCDAQTCTCCGNDWKECMICQSFYCSSCQVKHLTYFGEGMLDEYICTNCLKCYQNCTLLDLLTKTYPNKDKKFNEVCRWHNY